MSNDYFIQLLNLYAIETEGVAKRLNIMKNI